MNIKQKLIKLFNKNMKTTININGKDVEITLTAEQVEKINKSSMKITDRIKTFKDACDYLNISTHKDAYNLLKLNRQLNPNILLVECEDTYLKLIIITLALNEGNKINLANETGYFSYFDYKKKPGSGFVSSDFDRWTSSSSVSSRLALRTSALAKYSGMQFESLHYEYGN